MVICSLHEVSYIGFTAIEVVIYRENFNHAAQGRMVTCGHQSVLCFGYTAVEVGFYPIFTYGGSDI